MTKNKTLTLLALFFLNMIIVCFSEINMSIESVLKIHIFLVLLSFLEERLRFKIIKEKQKIIYFLGVNFFKIILCLVFLAPNILVKNSINNTYIYTFFIVYFVILFYDIFAVLKTEKINR